MDTVADRITTWLKVIINSKCCSFCNTVYSKYTVDCDVYNDEDMISSYHPDRYSKKPISKYYSVVVSGFDPVLRDTYILSRSIESVPVLVASIRCLECGHERIVRSILYKE